MFHTGNFQEAKSNQSMFCEKIINPSLSPLKLISLKKHVKSMDKRTQFMYRLVFGVVIIGGVIFLSFKYLMKGPPFLKVLVIGLIAAVTYLVVDYLKKKSKEY